MWYCSLIQNCGSADSQTWNLSVHRIEPNGPNCRPLISQENIPVREGPEDTHRSWYTDQRCGTRDRPPPHCFSKPKDPPNWSNGQTMCRLSTNLCALLIVYYRNVRNLNAESQTDLDSKAPQRPPAAPPPEASKNPQNARTRIRQTACTENALDRTARCPAHPYHSTVAPALLPTTPNKGIPTTTREEDTNTSATHFLLFTGWVIPRV